MSILEIKHLTKKFGDHEVLKDINLEIALLLKEYNMETENNTKRGGLKKEFLEILKKHKISLHLSSDAHRYYEIGRDFNDYVQITFD